MYIEPNGKKINSRIKIAIIYKENRMSICTQKTFKNKESGDSMEINIIYVLSQNQAGRVAELIGFYPKEGDMHYIDEKDSVRELKIRDIITSL